MHRVEILYATKAYICLRAPDVRNLIIQEKTKMNKTMLQKLLSCILCIVLIAAMALVTSSCTGNTEKKNGDKDNVESPELSLPSGEGDFDDNIIGEGEKDFKFSATDLKGNVFRYHIYTDAETVGEALQDAGLVEGEEGAYGLYVKTVCGITADYDKTKTYWKFCIAGEESLTGVDSTDIESGQTYNFVESK